MTSGSIPAPNPTSRPQSSAGPAAPIPPPVPVETHPNRAGLGIHPLLRPPPDPSRLAPEDAYFAHSPPRLRPLNVPNNHATTNPDLLNRVVATPAAVAALRPPPAVPGLEPKVAREPRRDRGRSRRRKRQWKKLLWERVSPVSVVSWATICTIFCWGLWDYWEGRAQPQAEKFPHTTVSDAADDCSTSGSLSGSVEEGSKGKPTDELGLSLETSSTGSPLSRQNTLSSTNSGNTSATSVHSAPSPISSTSPVTPNLSNSCPDFSDMMPKTAHGMTKTSSSISYFSTRTSQRLITAKSALLIFCALQGLSPILKSLTKSTTSDSIWAMSWWLMIINVFFFDYGSSSNESHNISNNTGAGAGAGAVAAKFPASLSTNAALMASTVLASRLRSTTHVFSLTLFSIEVFGLFPIFRRHLRGISWRGHVVLTVFLVIAAGAAVGVTLKGGYKGVILGIFFGAPLTALIMGGCSWWLIGLQKYKNVVAGPWDQAKPILRRHWD
ncbi:glycosylphosphatidylinositol anchor biosynthesis [Emydomyces testavorans]|uniref:Glycosylphosphatidylinositol anchor biosynthesis n=1 Tax=Emydomyces testavorans TaxID=2070801 RepID=A0AAF0DH82_9EURO|nr:glycosylphosphatidylinositol anchor biosynthesis [Emydomyces testavorans]